VSSLPLSVVRVDHTAIVVADMDEAVPRWQAMVDGDVELRQPVSHQRVEIAMLRIGNTRLELVSPLDESSGVARFLERRGEGLHHIGLEVVDITDSIESAQLAGLSMIDDEPRRGVHGLIAFIHPRSTGGVLLELIQHDQESMLQA
jgi:methylmalonyl-CoA epimerase